MRQNFLPFWLLTPLGEEEIAEIADSRKSGWITTGPKSKSFAVNSCTARLHIADSVDHGGGRGRGEDGGGRTG